MNTILKVRKCAYEGLRVNPCIVDIKYYVVQCARIICAQELGSKANKAQLNSNTGIL